MRAGAIDSWSRSLNRHSTGVGGTEQSGGYNPASALLAQIGFSSVIDHIDTFGLPTMN
jgi:hypothetical protein